MHFSELEKNESGGLDDTFGGGNVIIETLAALVVLSAKPPTTNIPFQITKLQVVQEQEE